MAFERKECESFPVRQSLPANFRSVIRNTTEGIPGNTRFVE